MNTDSTRRRGILQVLTLALLVCAATPAVQAQTEYGRLTVTINVQPLDQERVEGVRGIKVVVRDESNRTRTCDLREPGVGVEPQDRCEFEALEPGNYSIDVSSPRALPPTPTLVARIAPGQHVVRTVTLVLIPENEDLTRLSRLRTEGDLVPPAPLVVDESLNERIFTDRQGVLVRAAEEDRRPRSNERHESVLETQPGAVNTGGGALGFSLFGIPDRQNVLRIGGISVLAPELQDTSFQDTGALIFDVSKRRSIKSYSSFSASTNNTPAKLGTGTGGQLVEDITKGGKNVNGEVYAYFTNDRFNARNFFDFARKPELRYSLFGVKLGGPLVVVGDSTKLAIFANYEGIRALSGRTVFEAAPSDSLRARAAAAVLPLFDSFRAGGASVVPGASSDPNFDILRLDAKNRARKDAFTARLDFTPNNDDTLNFIYLGASSKEDTPDGATGRRVLKGDSSQAAIFNYNRVLRRSGDDPTLSNEFIFGFKSDPSRLDAGRTYAGGIDLSRAAVSIGGKVEQTGVPGLSSPLSLATPGGLLRGVSSFSGRALNFTPRSLSFVDQLIWRKSSRNTFTFGGEVRLLRNSINRLFGSTYSFASLDDFLANRLSSAEFVGDLGSFTGGTETGERRTGQEYYIAYAQDAFTPRQNMKLTYGLRYEYYSVLRESRDRAVVFDPTAGTLLPPGAPFYKSRRNNFLPRVAFAWSPRPSGEKDNPINASSTVVSASFGMHVGPDALDTILRPIYSDSIRARQEGGAFPADTGALAAAFGANTAGRAFVPLAISRDFSGPALLYKFDVGFKRELLGREVANNNVVQELFLTLGYSGNRGSNLPLINFANRIVSVETNTDPTRPALVRREFDVVSNGQTLSPFGEVEYFTSGGKSKYDSLLVTLTGVSTKNYLQLLEVQYTWAKNRGNTDPDSTVAAGNPADYSYDYGYNSLDVRHKFSFAAILNFPARNTSFCTNKRGSFPETLLCYWTFAAVGSYQTGQPIDVRLKRADVVYIDAAGRVFNSPAAGRRALLNTPGGGSSVAAFRPDLVAGMNPYMGGFNDRSFLNPAAFAIPAPGVLGNLQRGDLRGPRLRLFDISISKEFILGRAFAPEAKTKLVFNMDVNNLFNFTNFKLSSATLPDVLGFDGTSGKLQPGEPFTSEAAGTFGILNRTFKRKQDLGASRQIQFRLALQF